MNSIVWISPAQNTTLAELLTNQTEAIDRIFDNFATPYQSAGGSPEKEKYKEDYISFVKHANIYMAPSKIAPQPMWSLGLFDNPKSKTSWKNLSLLIESLLVNAYHQFPIRKILLIHGKH